MPLYWIVSKPSVVQSFEKVPELDSRKFPEPFVDIALGRLKENPRSRAMAIPVEEVQPAPNSLQFDIRLRLYEHFPPLGAAL